MFSYLKERMLLEISIALLLGLLAGTFTGLSPGIHINLIAALLTSSLTLSQTIPAIALVVFIVSMSITHTFIDFIPSIFLGAPEEDSFLSILPGHQLLQRGEGHEAVLLTLYGSLLSLLIILIFIPIFIYLLPKISLLIAPLLPFILIFASLYLIFREEEFLISLVVFLLAGFLGFLSLNLPINQPLLPLLTGLFGTSALLVSIKSKTSLPPQKIIPLFSLKISKLSLLKSFLSAALIAPFSSFLPGMGSGHAAVLASELSEKTHSNPRNFLFLVGAINTIIMALSFITIYSIDKTRTGSAVAVKEILKTITKIDLSIIIATIFISGFLAFILGIKISKFIALNINKINYTYLSISILLILLIVNMLFSGLLGLIVLITATSLGVFTILSKARRINLMGALLIPTILFYLVL